MWDSAEIVFKAVRDSTEIDLALSRKQTANILLFSEQTSNYYPESTILFAGLVNLVRLLTT